MAGLNKIFKNPLTGRKLQISLPAPSGSLLLCWMTWVPLHFWSAPYPMKHITVHQVSPCKLPCLLKSGTRAASKKVVNTKQELKHNVRFVIETKKVDEKIEDLYSCKQMHNLPDFKRSNYQFLTFQISTFTNQKYKKDKMAARKSGKWPCINTFVSVCMASRGQENIAILALFTLVTSPSTCLLKTMPCTTSLCSTPEP